MSLGGLRADSGVVRGKEDERRTWEVQRSGKRSLRLDHTRRKVGLVSVHAVSASYLSRLLLRLLGPGTIAFSFHFYCTIARRPTCLPSCFHRGPYLTVQSAAGSNTLCSNSSPQVPQAVHHAKRHASPVPYQHHNHHLHSLNLRNHGPRCKHRKMASQYGRSRKSSKSSFPLH